MESGGGLQDSDLGSWKQGNSNHSDVNTEQMGEVRSYIIGFELRGDVWKS